jgi:hypothetical protein
MIRIEKAEKSQLKKRRFSQEESPSMRRATAHLLCIRIFVSIKWRNRKAH